MTQNSKTELCENNQYTKPSQECLISTATKALPILSAATVKNLHFHRPHFLKRFSNRSLSDILYKGSTSKTSQQPRKLDSFKQILKRSVNMYGSFGSQISSKSSLEQNLDKMP